MNNQDIHVSEYYRSLNKNGEELCGDKVEIRRNEASFIMVLADGLGSGVKANILSTLTSTILSTMLSEGSTLQECVETVAHTLPECQERHVAYSTFTILQVFKDGATYLAEFDNPSAILLREGRVVSLQKNTMEFSGRKVLLCNFRAEPNDFVVMFSDGIIHAGVGQVLNLGWDQKEVEEFLIQYTKPSDTAKEVTRLLLANVNSLYGGEPGDDSTVAVSKLVSAVETRVMVGPPEVEEEDTTVVHRLMEANGKKICCGGTTSQIVSRVLGRPITMDSLVSLVSDVPPMAYIEGVDYVTEGVLTLQKVNRTLQKCVEDPLFRSEVETSKERDAATLLTQSFLLDCTEITFMVGRSDNPAHKALAYSTISLNAKIQVIEEIAHNLEKLGKLINIELY